MARLRLRPAWTPEQLGKVYSARYNSGAHIDHHIRLSVTAAVATWFTHGEVNQYRPIQRVADLSCGDKALHGMLAGPKGVYCSASWALGDFVSGPGLLAGPIEETIDEIDEVDLFILSETLEHLDDPDVVLGKIRDKTRFLLMSTPIGEDNDQNWEHYWGWGVEDIEKMLTTAGFTPQVCNQLWLPGRNYDFQIWGCS